MLPKQHPKLRAVFLYVPHIIKQQFQEAGLALGKMANATGNLLCQLLDGNLEFCGALAKICEKLVFGIDSFGQQPFWIQLILGEWFRRYESFNRAAEIKVQPEQSVVGHISEFREFRRHGFVIPQPFYPKFIRVGPDLIIQHLNGCPELAPKSGF